MGCATGSPRGTPVPDLLAQVCRSVAPTDPRSARLSRMRQLTLARPAGSLGQLDETVHRIAAIRGYVDGLGVLPSVVSVLAGDHGVARHRVSAFRPETTAAVFALVADERAPVNVLARQVPAPLHATDIGLAEPIGDQTYKVGAGTADLCAGDAMPVEHAHRAVDTGIRWATDRLASAALVAVGELGVGNTTSAAALAARLLGVAPDGMVGAGSGVDATTAARKRELVVQALARTASLPDDPVRLLAALGGYEIAGNVGVILSAASRRQVVVLDGFITGVAALVAVRLCPAVRGYLVAGHRSTEPGHAAVLAALGLRPLLALDMRLGMASGAVLALGLIGAALAVDVDVPPARLVGLADVR